MTLDLRHALDDLARTVHDDAVTDRMTGQVHHMVTRVRRRRAARRTALGAVGAGAAAAVVVGGVQVAERLRPERVPVATAGPQEPTPSATGSATPTPEPTTTPPVLARPEADAALAALLAAPSGEFPACGSEVALDDAAPLALDPLQLPTTVRPGEDLSGPVTLRTTDGRSVIGNASGAGATVVLVRDGVVVGRPYRDAEDTTLVDLGPQDGVEQPGAGAATLCTGTETPGLPLPEGEYTAYAVLEVLLKEVTTADGEASAVTELTRAVSPGLAVRVEGVPVG